VLRRTSGKIGGQKKKRSENVQKSIGTGAARQGSLDRFHLIIPEIGILSFGNQVSEFLFPFNHLYQACSGPGLREVPVDTFQLSGSRKICISFGNLKDENGKTES